MSTITLAMALAIAYPPPPKYDYEPLIPYTVEVLSHDQVQYLCLSAVEVWACTWNPTKTIYITNRATTEARAVILRHEKGHINGWWHPPVKPRATWEPYQSDNS